MPLSNSSVVVVLCTAAVRSSDGWAAAGRKWRSVITVRRTVLSFTSWDMSSASGTNTVGQRYILLLYPTSDTV